MGPASDLRSVVDALNFQRDQSAVLHGIHPHRWPNLLSLTDQAQLTLPLGLRHRDTLPAPVQSRIDANLARNAERTRRTREAYTEIADEFRRQGIDHLVLKGMTHFPGFCDDLTHRPQFDIDFYCPAEFMEPAAAAVASLGYESMRPPRGPATDHLPAMIRKTGYIWQGDYYDPELPLIVELHFRFWNPAREAFPVHGADRFWSRRVLRNINGCEVPALHPLDDLAYTTWHLVRHLVRGNLRLYHVYELAHFLDGMSSEDSFWEDWSQSSEHSRTAEPIAFRLAAEWFGCRLHPVVAAEISCLPASVDRWFRLFSFSAVAGMERPNKDELFLHLALAQGIASRCRILAHKLMPVNPPRIVMDAHVKENSLRIRLQRAAFRARFLCRRAWRHVSAWLPIAQSGLRWLLAGFFDERRPA